MNKGSLIAVLILSVVLAFCIGFCTASLWSPFRSSRSSGEVIYPESRSVIEITEITPERGAGVQASESYSGHRIMSWSDTGPNATVRQIQPMGFDKEGNFAIGGFRSLAMKDFSRGPVILSVIGVIAILVGIAVIVITKGSALTTGLWIIAGGAAALGLGMLIEAFPWVLWIFAILILGAGVGFVWYTYFYKKSTVQLATTTKVLTGVIQGVELTEATNPMAAASVKANIGAVDSANGGVIKSVVSATKKKLGIIVKPVATPVVPSVSISATTSPPVAAPTPTASITPNP